MKELGALLLAVTCGGCRATAPGGVFSCLEPRDCPQGLYCDSNTNLCERGSPAMREPERAAGQSGAADAGRQTQATGAADGGGLIIPPALDAGPVARAMDASAGGSAPTTPAGGAGSPAAVSGGSGGMVAIGGAGAGGAAACGTPLDSDARNCGSCGHDCLGAQCSGGKCEPLRLAWTYDHVEELALGDDAIYFSEVSFVKKVSYDGGEVTELATELAIHQIALDPSYVYVGQILGGLFKIPRKGGDPIMLTPNGYTQWVSTDGAYVYWLGSTATDNVVMRIPVGGGTPEALSSHDSGSAMTIDAKYAYWTTKKEHALYKVPLAGGTTEAVAMNLTAPSVLAVDAQHIFWADDTELTLNQMNIDGSNPSVIANNVHCTDIALDASFVYWVDNVDQGAIMKRAFTGGANIVLAATQTPTALAVNDKFVYWLKLGPSARTDADADDQKLGELLRVAK